MTRSISSIELTSLYGADPSLLKFDSTIDKTIVHKAAPEAVILTDSIKTGENEILLSGLLPRVNSPSARALSPRFARYDFGALFEMTRQATLVVAHQYFDVPLNWATLLRDMTMELVDVSVTGPMTRPVGAIIKVHIARDITKRGRVKGAHYTLEVFVENVLVALATATGLIMSPEKYEIARSAGRNALLAHNPQPRTFVTPIDPALVGMKAGSSTVIGELAVNDEPGSFRALVRVDTDDLFYYDHPISHVPGVVSCEAMRQAAIAAACLAHSELTPDATIVRSFKARFSGYAEPDIDLDIAIRLGAVSPTVHGTLVSLNGVLTQIGTELVTAHYEIEFATA